VLASPLELGLESESVLELGSLLVSAWGAELELGSVLGLACGASLLLQSELLQGSPLSSAS
jgi:hypothetical protein